MKKYIAWVLVLLSMAEQLPARAAADGFWTTNADAHYHLDPACTSAARMFPISEEAALYFGKLACPACIGAAWEPYFTGDFGEWDYDYIEPWALTDGFVPSEQRWEKRYQKGSPDPSKLDNAFARYGIQDDYCGRYYGASGDLVVMLTNPTVERAEQYAEICGGDIWVIEAEYSLAELAEAQQGMYDLIDQWNSGHERKVRMMMSSYGNGKDYVEAILDGAGVIDFMAEQGASLHPAVQADYPMLDARASGVIPPVQPDSYAGEGYTLSMVQDSYPVGTQSIGIKLEVAGGGLLDYEFNAALYKYAGDEAAAMRLQEAWKSRSYMSSVFKYAADGYVRLASDYAADIFGTANDVLYYEWSIAQWGELGEGLYRLDTGMGTLEFTVQSGAAPLQMPEISKPDFEVPAHAVNYADVAAYISDEDPNRAGYDVLLAGDRIYWIHTARHSDVEMGYAQSTILCAPKDDPRQVSVVYTAVGHRIHDLVDANGIIFLEDIGQDMLLRRISYDGSESEVLATRSGYVGGMMMIGDKLYYCDDQHIYSYDLAKGAQSVVFTTEDSIYSDFQAYEGKLVVSVVNWSDEDESAIYAVDLETQEARRVKQGKHFFYMVRDGKLYTSDDFGGDRLDSYQKFADGLYVSDWDNAASGTKYALIGWDGSRMDNLPGGLFELGGRLYIRDEHGNISVAELSNDA